MSSTKAVNRYRPPPVTCALAELELAQEHHAVVSHQHPKTLKMKDHCALEWALSGTGVQRAGAEASSRCEPCKALKLSY